jgi:hypothetical protein
MAGRKARDVPSPLLAKAAYRRRRRQRRNVAVAVARKNIDDAAMADPLLDHIADPMASFIAGSAYNQDQVSQTVAKRIRTLPSVRLGCQFVWGVSSSGVDAAQLEAHFQFV